MKAIPSARSRSYRGALRPVLNALLVLVSIGAAATEQSRDALVQQLDSITGAGVLEKRAVGITAAVVSGKDTLLLKAYGKSGVEADMPMTVDTVIQIGSTTKQFTAAAILQLRDQGKLGLDDDIAKWLPDFDTRGNKVTLRHLLGHTSGVGELLQIPELRAMKMVRNPTVTLNDVYKIVSRHPFRFPTGSMPRASPPRCCRWPPAASPFTGDAALLAGTYKGLGHNGDMVVDVTQTPQGIAFSVEGGAAGGPLIWVENWTFRRNAVRVTFRRSGNSRRAAELRFDTGGDHFILKRQ